MAVYPHQPQTRRNRPKIEPQSLRWSLGRLGPQSGVIATTISARLWVCGPWICPATAIATTISADPGPNTGRLILLGLYQSVAATPAGAILVAQTTTTTSGEPQTLQFAANTVHGSTYWLALVNTGGTYPGLPAVPAPGLSVWFVVSATLPQVLPAVAVQNQNTALALQIALTLA